MIQTCLFVFTKNKVWKVIFPTPFFSSFSYAGYFLMLDIFSCDINPPMYRPPYLLYFLNNPNSKLIIYLKTLRWARFFVRENRIIDSRYYENPILPLPTHHAKRQYKYDGFVLVFLRNLFVFVCQEHEK